MKVTLLQKRGRISTNDFVTTINNALSNLKGDLSVTSKFTEFSQRGWAVIDVQGDDREIFLQLVKRRFNLAKSNFQTIEVHGIYSSQIARFNHDLEVDVGVEFPDPVEVTVKLASLRAQLTDGSPVPVKQIQEAYCLFPGSQLDIRITMLTLHEPVLTGWLADSQIELFSEWINSGLDRLLILNCTVEQLNSAIRETKLERDIVAVESLNLTTHTVSCKLGTDGVGLIPKLGTILRKSEIKLFLPRRIRAISRSW